MAPLAPAHADPHSPGSILSRLSRAGARPDPVPPNLRPVLTATLAVLVSAAVAAGESLRVPDFPIPVNQARSANTRRLAKPVLDQRLLDDMESPAHWQLFGPGAMTFTTDRHRDGTRSLRLTSATKTADPPPVQGRPFAETGVRRQFGGEDWTPFNRLSVWVHPDLPGFHTVSLLLKLNSEGTEGRSYTDGGMNFVLLNNHAWNQVVWEIPHLERARVQSLDLVYRLQGNEPGAADHVQFDFDQLELQRVEADPFRGWTLAPGVLAWNHLGYAPSTRKVALAPVAEGTDFALVRTADGSVAWSGHAARVESPLGFFRVLDFSPFRQSGNFRLRCGTLESQPFEIREEPWRDSILAVLNQFFCQRCGDAVPGIHGVCHQDWRAEHQGRFLTINGGWHDAGDLSQGLVNTSEAAASMLRLADRLPSSEASLANRLRTEARWGVEWLLKTRFGDGARVTWATMDFWTDGVIGNQDDVVVRAGRGAFDNFTAAAAEAACARAFRETDPAFAARCLEAAQADWEFARAQLGNPRVEEAAAGAQASLELHRAQPQPDRMTEAMRLAGILLASQQLEAPAWDRPLSGFFYTSPDKKSLLHYNHRSHEQAPAVVLADLCEAFPEAPAAPRWRQAVKAYAGYLKAAAAFNEPYGTFPAGIYRTADFTNPSEREQVRQGIRLTEGIFLRRFPVWGDFRGNLGVQLSQAFAAARAARLLNDQELRKSACDQIDWVLGRNPFGQSLMYGVGYNYAPQYTAMSGDITGTLPVGIQTRLAEDAPYWPASNCYNYAEVWVHPASRWLATLAELR